MQHLANAHLDLIATGHFKGIMFPAVFCQQRRGCIALGHALLQLMQLLLLRLEPFKDGQHLGMDRIVATAEGIHRFLAQIAKARALR